MCRIGHTFSGESLIECKEGQLEESLWEVVETYEEIAILHEEMSRRARAGRARGIAQAYRRRAGRAAALGKDVRAIISKDAPAEADRGRA